MEREELTKGVCKELHGKFYELPLQRVSNYLI
jgi:hypothetical protein